MKNFKFDPVEHVYTLDDKPLRGTTTVLKVINKPMLIPWAVKTCGDYILQNWEDRVYTTKEKEEFVKEAKRQHTKKKEDAGVAGTDVHALIEEVIKEAIEKSQGMIVEECKHNGQVKLFWDWATQNSVKFLASEQQLYSETHWYAGTADFICEIGGKLYVGDVKTSSGIYPEHFIQASAYAMGLVEMGLYEQFGGVIVVNVPKAGGISVRENYDVGGNFDAFRACLTLTKQLEAIK